MLVASLHGQRVEADVANRGDHFSCPNCTASVILKRGSIKIAHFAHLPDQGCNWSVGETIGHLTAKKSLCNAMRRKGLKAELEYVVNDRRIDVAVWLPNGHLVAIEVQHSTLSVDDLIERMVAYQNYKIRQIWLPFLRKSSDALYAARPYERYLMRMSQSGLWCWDELTSSLIKTKFFSTYYQRVRLATSASYNVDDIELRADKAVYAFAELIPVNGPILPDWSACHCDLYYRTSRDFMCEYCYGFLCAKCARVGVNSYDELCSTCQSWERVRRENPSLAFPLRSPV